MGRDGHGSVGDFFELGHRFRGALRGALVGIGAGKGCVVYRQNGLDLALVGSVTRLKNGAFIGAPAPLCLKVGLSPLPGHRQLLELSQATFGTCVCGELNPPPVGNLEVRLDTCGRYPPFALGLQSEKRCAPSCV